ncbi:MAG TPA: RNA-protein complex protein Nop10 [Methanolinea sp.]|nr:RNA-protein complex protein Nop10 [Methanolinea sp.]MDI6898901.1 RNA-protein complex protein Nop10 [Methanolinea sp.]HOS81456.1 RNA-protein complex protein Nop10 [Methanolinea sp.]HPC56021.1 RNA-protein complex protein Nop10 [Methanolinea sp.]HQE85675.1 RNA-protein complex protein Nop10 [Methanolinea sp.]
MSGRLRRCPRDRTYTLKFSCPVCGHPTVPAHPARFSPSDSLGRYRRIARGWTI